jgi:hypothetical protein
MKLKFSHNLFKKNLTNLILLGLIGLIIFGCVCRSGRENISNKQVEVEKVQETEKPFSKSQNSEKIQDKGDFLVEFVELKNSKYTEIDKQIKDEKLLENAANQLNKSLNLPYNITLRTKDCEEVNALYDPNDHSITVCYELMEYFHRTFKNVGKSEEIANQKMFDVVRFVFLHELGHALIDAYSLPITGNEEDAADRLSAYICLEELGAEGVRSAVTAAEAFALQSKNNSNTQRDFYDEHLLEEQRFYNILCMIYGSDTKKHSDIVDSQHLPKERAVRCENEYAKTSQSWKNLLKPYRKR